MKRLYGVKLYDKSFCNSRNLDIMQSCGFNTVFLGRGALSREFTDMLSDRGFFWNIVEPVFLLQPEDETALATLQDGEKAESDWVRFACPTDAEHFESVRKRVIDDIDTYSPPGISLDFIRFFQFWETTEPDMDPGALPRSCFCPRCQRQMKVFKSTGDWRQNVIEQTDRSLCAEARVRKDDIRIGIHCVPWTSKMFDGAITDIIGQDFGVLSEVGDYLTPMVYHHMMKLSPSYVREFITEMAQQGCPEILPSIQVKEAYRKDEMSASEFEQALILALGGPSKGVVLYKWEDLVADNVRLDIVRKNLGA